MNCQTVQRRLLATPNPARVSASVRAHLAECRACRDMQHHLTQIEQAVPALIVPSSSFAKAALLRKVRHGPTLREKVVQSVEGLPAALRRMGRWQMAGAGLAAAVLVMLLSWPLFRGPGPDPTTTEMARSAEPDPLLANVLQRQLTLAEAKEPRQQVQALAKLSDDLKGAVQGLARTSESREALPDLAGWYGLVVRTEVVRAGKLAPNDRKDVLAPVAQSLANTATELDALAAQVGAPAAHHPLRTLAAAAREAKTQLDALTRMQTKAAPRPRGGAGRSSFAMIPLLLVAAPADDAAVEVRRFQRNRDLINVVVEGSVRLAEVDDPVQRAAACSSVARGLAQAIQLAAAERESARALELGEHLRQQLERGIAANLNRAGKIELGSALDNQIKDVVRGVDRAVQPLEEQVERSGDAKTRAAMQRTLRTVLDGRAEIDKVLKRDEQKP